MFRASLQQTLRKPLLCPPPSKNQLVRNQSSSSGGGKKFILAVTGVAAATTGTVLAAKYSENFRKKIEESVPYSSKAFDAILSPKDAKIRNDAQKVDDSLLKKKLQRDLNSKIPQAVQKPSENELHRSTAPQNPAKTETPVEKKLTKPEQESQQYPHISSGSNQAKSETSPSIDKVTVDSSVKRKASDSKNNYIDEPQNSKELEALKQEYERKVNILRDEFEDEIRTQLKRQLAAHLDHLREQLDVQRFELQRQYTIAIEDKILEEKSRYATQLIENMSKLKEIETVLISRQQLDVDERKARELWLICEILNDSLKSKRLQSDKNPTTFSKLINEIKAAVKSMKAENSLITTVLETVPESALNSGVYTEDDLIDRFKRIEKMCKRVALIGEEGGSISRYLLSYLQSLLLFDRNVSFGDEVSGVTMIDASKWDTFDVLSRIRYCLNERNLEMSLKYANQLRGKPRQIAIDWINDLRTHIELRQVADVLQATAVSTTLRAVN